MSVKCTSAEQEKKAYSSLELHIGDVLHVLHAGKHDVGQNEAVRVFARDVEVHSSGRDACGARVVCDGNGLEQRS